MLYRAFFFGSALFVCGCGGAAGPAIITTSQADEERKDANAEGSEGGPSDDPDTCAEGPLDLPVLRGKLEEAGADCHKILKVESELAPHGCQVSTLGNGSTLLVYAETECSGDSCSGHTWVINAHTCGPLRLSHEYGIFEASPDGRFILIDVPIEAPEMTAVGPVADFELGRIDIPTQGFSTFAPCMSARLSPGGKWILCRNRQADVLKVPLSGGVPEVVVRVGAEHVQFVPYAQIYPAPVRFSSPTELVYSVDDESSIQSGTHSVVWEE